MSGRASPLPAGAQRHSAREQAVRVRRRGRRPLERDSAVDIRHRGTPNVFNS